MAHSLAAYRSNKLRLDSAAMFMCIFAIIGGVYVLRSFAQTPIDATRPGVVALQDTIANPESATRERSYFVSMTEGLQYCFFGTYSANATITAEAKLDATLTHQQRSFTDSSTISKQLVCLSSPKTQSATVKLKITGHLQIRSLEVM